MFAFAFPKKRKKPLSDVSHFRNAIARFNQVGDATDEEREQAFANIKKAAKHDEDKVAANSWRLGQAPRQELISTRCRCHFWHATCNSLSLITVAGPINLAGFFRRQQGD